MLTKPLRTWIVVVDGAHARFVTYSSNKSGQTPQRIREFDRHSGPSRDIVSDKPGRSFDRKGHNRHAIEPRVDAHEEAEKHFLRDVMKQLEDDFDARSFDHCVIVSPPRALGYLRHLIPSQLKQRVVLELDKDMIKNTDKEIAKTVAEALSSVPANERLRA